MIPQTIRRYLPLRPNGAITNGTAAWTTKSGAVAAVRAIGWPLKSIHRERTWDHVRVWVLSDGSGEGYITWDYYNALHLDRNGVLPSH